MYYKKNGVYVDRNGQHASKLIISKIKSIYIPPGYKNVIYHLKSKLLATGMDSKGRTQYIYSDAHKNARTNKRKDTCKKVSLVIHKIKNYISKNFMNDQIALVLKLIDECNFRVGEHNNTKRYKHYGVTTLLPKHFHFGTKICKIKFIGKKGVVNESIIKCNKTINCLKRLTRKTKTNVFNVTSIEVNQFLKQFKITNKDIRTWNANIHFIQEAMKCINIEDPKKRIKEVLLNTSKQMHNTPTVIKNSYVVGDVYKAILNGKLKKKGCPEKFLNKILLVK